MNLAQQLSESTHLDFTGLQMYAGNLMHIAPFSDRREQSIAVMEKLADFRNELKQLGIACRITSGGGTGTFDIDPETGALDELQAGSYAFMDADYGRNLMEDGSYFKTFEQSLFVLATVMSRPEDGLAVIDAGLKAIAVDSGYAVPHGLPDVEHVGASDEHGKLILGINAPLLTVGTKIRLIPGHCDPTVNLHDWYVCVRDGVVENIWPIAARGAVF